LAWMADKGIETWCVPVVALKPSKS
jgi:hypothetical protein